MPDPKLLDVDGFHSAKSLEQAMDDTKWRRRVGTGYIYSDSKTGHTNKSATEPDFFNNLLGGLVRRLDNQLEDIKKNKKVREE